MAIAPKKIIPVKPTKQPPERNTDAGSTARKRDWTQQLAAQQTVQLDASGNGITFIGPLVAREYWELTQANVSVNSVVLEAQCIISVGTGGTAVQIIDSTRTGSSGDTVAFGSIVLDGGSTIIAQWLAGDANSFATLKLYGVRRRYGGEE